MAKDLYGLTKDLYGLTDARVLQVAQELIPELFTALSIAKQLEDSRFPIQSHTEIEHILAAISNETGIFESSTIRITTQDAKNNFPTEFLPITDHLDLIRKTYMAILINHKANSRARLQSTRTGDSLVSEAVTSVILSAGQKTEVLWSSFVFKTYRIHFSYPNQTIEWERNSDLPPFQTKGTHNSSQDFLATVGGAYCNFWMTSHGGNSVTIS